MSKTSTRRQFLQQSAASAAIVSASSLMGRPSHAAEDDVNVVGLFDETGGLDIYGMPIVMNMQLAVEEINANGGLLGRKLNHIRYDSQSNMQLYAQFAQEAALKHQPAFVHAGVTSASREVIRPIFRRYNTLYWYSTGYEGGVCDINTFCSGTTPAGVIKALMEWAIPEHGKKIYVLGADYIAPQVTAVWAKRFAEEYGGEIIATEFFPLEVFEFGPTINKIQSAKPDMVCSILVGNNHVGFYRQWAAAGMLGKIPIVGNIFGGGNEHILMSPEETNGIASVYGYWQEIDTPLNHAFVKRFADRFGADHPYLNAIAVGGYEGTMLWAKGVEIAGSFEREKVIAALRSGLTWDGPGGTITMDPKTNHAIRDVHIAVANNKSMDVVKTVEQVYPADSEGRCDLEKNPDDNTQYTPAV